MESFQRLVRSLRSGRSVELPADENAAYFMLLSYVMQNEYRTFTDLLATTTTFNINFKSHRGGRTLLHMAANVDAYECLCLLLKKGAQPDTFDLQGLSPLQVAARNGFTRCILRLLDYGADLITKNNEGMTAIHWLASNGRTEVFSEIKKYVKDIDIVDQNGQTPLHVASLNGHIGTVLKLINEFNADVDRLDHYGCNPLFFACRHGQANVVTELLKYTSALDPSHDGESPIFAALKGGYYKVCLELIKWRSDNLEMLLRYCQSKEIDDEKMINVLIYISSQHPQYRNKILLQFAKYVYTEGMKLLSQNPDISEVPDSFLKNIAVFNALSSPHTETPTDITTRQRLTSAVNRTRSQSVSSLFEGKPDNIKEIEMEFDTLWVTMEHWLQIILKEICREEEELRTTTEGSKDEGKEPAMENGHKTLFRSNSSRLLLRTVSRTSPRTSTNLEQLLWSQPAYTVNNKDGAYLTRSDSYNNALSSIDDDFEKALSPSVSYANNLSSDEKVEFDKNLIDLIAYRLCAAIHGYHLYCSVNPSWNGRDGNIKRVQFGQFIKKHEEALVMLVSRDSRLIFEHFSFILENPVLLQRFLPAIHCHPLADRQKWFYEKLHDDKNRRSVVMDEESVMTITRNSLLQTSCKELNSKKEAHLKGSHMNIRFQGEQGMGEGVVREWLDLLVKEILNPDCALFTLSADGRTFQPNSNSSINPDHLNYFLFAGKIMGLALYHKHLITTYFTRSFYKHILGIPVNYKDVESIDPVFSKNLQTILDNEIDELGLEIPFSVETSVFGEIKEVELKENGTNIFVNDSNKFEYVNLVADLKMTKAIKPQIHAFLEGFYQFVPLSLISMFNEYELELLLSGVPDIDLEDWRKNTMYQSGFKEDDHVIKWFWEVVESFSQEKQVQLLQFATGTSRVPWGGFAKLNGTSGNQQFTISLQPGEVKMLPTASTCFNMLKLPYYESREELEQKLTLAIECGAQGFEFA